MPDMRRGIRHNDRLGRGLLVRLTRHNVNKKQVVKRTKHRAYARCAREAGGGRQRDSFPQARWVLGEAHFSNLAICNINKKHGLLVFVSSNLKKYMKTFYRTWHETRGETEKSRRGFLYFLTN